MKLPQTTGLVLAVLALFALAPLVISSGFVLNLLIMTLLTTVMAQAWNLLGGFGGQLSFGHAAFFGTGAYAMAILQVHTGLNAWVALIVALALSAALGAIIGGLAFRYGLRGSYFSLVTLAIRRTVADSRQCRADHGCGRGHSVAAESGLDASPVREQDGLSLLPARVRGGGLPVVDVARSIRVTARTCLPRATANIRLRRSASTCSASRSMRPRCRLF